MGLETRTIRALPEGFAPRSRLGGPSVSGTIIDNLVKASGSAEYLPITEHAFSEDQKSDWQKRAKSIRGILSKAAQARNAQVHSSLVIKGVSGGKPIPGLGAKDFGVLAYGAVALSPEQMAKVYGVRKNKKAGTNGEAGTGAGSTGKKSGK